MREIKFRAWDSKERRMLNVTHLDWMKEASTGRTTERSEGYFGDNHRRKFSLDEVSLMQFTGLLDKNGKEIYEGDLVRMKQSAWGFVEHLLVIEWSEEYFNLKTRCISVTEGGGKTGVGVGDSYSFSVLDRFKEQVEVIGNIYDNPELISSDKK